MEEKMGNIYCITNTLNSKKKVFSSLQYSMEEKYEMAKKWYQDKLYRKNEPQSMSATGDCDASIGEENDESENSAIA